MNNQLKHGDKIIITEVKDGCTANISVGQEFNVVSDPIGTIGVFLQYGNDVKIAWWTLLEYKGKKRCLGMFDYKIVE